MTEIEKWNDFLAKNYQKIKTHMNKQMFFQTFGDYSEDDVDETLTLIGEAVAKGYIIDYDNVMKLIFISYKNLCIQNRIRNQRYGDFNEYAFSSDDDDYQEIDTSIVNDMLKEVQNNFPNDYYNIVVDYMNNNLKYEDRGKWRMVKNYLRYKFGKRKETEYKKMLSSKYTPLYQYDKKGNLVAKYNSILDCYQKTGFNQKIIKKYLNGETDFAYSYHWELEKK